jgi:hypothetical protein
MSGNHSTVIRWYPRTGIVMLRSKSVTTTFRIGSTDIGARERHLINLMLDDLGYQRVHSWEPDGANFVARTDRARIRSAA